MRCSVANVVGSPSALTRLVSASLPFDQKTDRQLRPLQGPRPAVCNHTSFRYSGPHVQPDSPGG